jgi:hypothetical protein
MDSLSAIRANLLRELAGSDAKLRFINTRLILSVGIDLNEIAATDEYDPRKVVLTIQTLRKMGFLNPGEKRHGT